MITYPFRLFLRVPGQPRELLAQTLTRPELDAYQQYWSDLLFVGRAFVGPDYYLEVEVVVK